MEHDEVYLEKTLKKICLGYFYLVILVFISFSIYYFYENISFFKYYSTSIAITHIFLFFIPYKLEYKFIKELISVYLIFISIALYPFVTLYWAAGQVTVFVWYLLIPFAGLIFFSTRTVVYWTLYILFLFCTVFIVSNFIPERYVIQFESYQSSVLNIITIVCCLGLAAYFIFSLSRVNHIKMEILKKERINKSLEKVVDDVEDTEKYLQLYDSIEEYIENEKPYCDPNFTITQLATAVNSNITYVSKAIRISKDVNFNVLMNTYRINMIKDMLDKGYHNTFTIKHIYTSAGFKQQTTFNKVFKQIEGITPTDYIKSLQINTNQ